MKRTIALLAAVALLAAGCSEVRSGTLGPAPSAVPPAEHTAGPTPAATGTPSAPATSGIRPPPTGTGTGTGTPTSTGAAVDPSRSETVTIQLWFTRAGRIAPTRRTRPATVATSRLALTELAAGPTSAEVAAGLTTLLPAGVEIVRIVDGTATVAPPPAFSDGSPETVRLRQAQIVYTLTQFPTVRRVAFTPGDASLGRGDFTDLLPAIVVTGPAIGQQVTTPVTVTGTANVFEATVSVRVLDATGREIGTAFTTATCGSGCRGDYRATVAYRTATTGPATIEVYEVSAKDGTRTNVVAVPVTLTASAR